MLLGNIANGPKERTVSKEKGEEFADANDLPFYEVSAKENTNLNEAVYNLTNLILSRLENRKSGGSKLYTPDSVRLKPEPFNQELSKETPRIDVGIDNDEDSVVLEEKRKSVGGDEEQGCAC